MWYNILIELGFVIAEKLYCNKTCFNSYIFCKLYFYYVSVVVKFVLIYSDI